MEFSEKLLESYNFNFNETSKHQEGIYDDTKNDPRTTLEPQKKQFRKLHMNSADWCVPELEVGHQDGPRTKENGSGAYLSTLRKQEFPDVVSLFFEAVGEFPEPGDTRKRSTVV